MAYFYFLWLILCLVQTPTIRIYSELPLEDKIITPAGALAGIPLESVEDFADAQILLFAGGETFGSGVNISLATVAGFEFPQSPLLKTTFDSAARFDFPDGAYAYTDEIAFVAALAAYAAGDCDQAVTYFDQISSENHPYHYVQSSIDFYKANCALLEGDLEQAEIFYAGIYESTILNPTSNGVVNLAWIYFETNRVEQAFELLDQYVEQRGGGTKTRNYKAEALVIRAQFHALNFEFDAAIADVNSAIDSTLETRFDTDSMILPGLYVERGQLYLFLYEWDQVLADYNTALEINPDYADAYYYRGVLYYTVLVDREKALPDFAQYLELAPDGIHAEDAAQYQVDIQAELKALER